jgi:hypothetical protein
MTCRKFGCCWFEYVYDKIGYERHKYTFMENGFDHIKFMIFQSLFHVKNLDHHIGTKLGLFIILC